VLERDDANGYARVRLRDGGAEGWVLTRYLVDAPTANLELSDARAALAQARTRADSLQNELTATQQRLETTQAELATLQSTSSAMTEELADIREASASAIDLRDQNESLRRRNTELTAEVDQLVVDNAALASRNQQNWFIVGALVLAGGIVIGLVAPSLRRRRRTDW